MPGVARRARCAAGRAAAGAARPSATIRYWMLGRSKLATKCRASRQVEPGRDLGVRSRRSPSRSARSAARRASARAASTAPGSRAGSRGPTATTQCASSIANSAILPRSSSATVDGDPQPLGREVEQVELAGEERRLDHRAARSESWVELRKPARTPSAAQRVDLVLHQRDQRRDHHADAGPDQRRDLVAQRLAAAGRHQHQRVAAADDVLDDLGLLAAEGVVAEDPAQHIDSFGNGQPGCLGHAASLVRTPRRCWVRKANLWITARLRRDTSRRSIDCPRGP